MERTEYIPLDEFDQLINKDTTQPENAVNVDDSLSPANATATAQLDITAPQDIDTQHSHQLYQSSEASATNNVANNHEQFDQVDYTEPAFEPLASAYPEHSEPLENIEHTEHLAESHQPALITSNAIAISAESAPHVLEPHETIKPAATFEPETQAAEMVTDNLAANSFSSAVAAESIDEPVNPALAGDEEALPAAIPIARPVSAALPPRAQLTMPQFYLKTDNNQRVRGFLPSDDLQIEVQLPEKEPSRIWLWFSEVRSLVRDFLFAALTAVLIVVFVIQPVKVEGTSMLPRLHDGERIFINKFIYQFDSIQRGDIVVFWYPKNPSQSFIKRVIGIPGDEIRVTNGKLYINNKLVPEPYLSPEYTSNVAPNRYWLVEEHHYFVMGDNRDASNDSRSWGQVPEKYIYGKAVFRYWPLDRAGSLTN